MAPISFHQLQTIREFAPKGSQQFHHVACALRMSPEIIAGLQDAQTTGCNGSEPLLRCIVVHYDLLNIGASKFWTQPMRVSGLQLFEGFSARSLYLQRSGTSCAAVVSDCERNPFIQRTGYQNCFATAGVTDHAYAHIIELGQPLQSIHTALNAPSPDGCGRPSRVWPVRVHRTITYAIGSVVSQLDAIEPGQRYACFDTNLQRLVIDDMRPTTIWTEQNRAGRLICRPSDVKPPIQSRCVFGRHMPKRQNMIWADDLVCQLNIDGDVIGRQRPKEGLDGSQVRRRMRFRSRR